MEHEHTHPAPGHLYRGQHKKVQRRKVMDLKLAFSEFYLSLILLQNYQNLNFTGFRKILKKHDKLVKNDAGGRWREDYVECAHFHTNKVGTEIWRAGPVRLTTSVFGFGFLENRCLV